MIVTEPVLDLTQDGSRLVVAHNTRLQLVDCLTGARREFRSRDSARIASLPPDAAAPIAIAAGSHLELVDGAMIELDGRIVFVRRCGSFVVVVTASDTSGTHFGAYSDTTLEPRFDPTFLGNVSAHLVEPVSPSEIVMSGLSGTRPWDGVGEAYARGVTWDDAGVSVTWDGTGVDGPLRRLAASSGSFAAVVDQRVIMGSTSDLLAGHADRATSVAVDAGFVRDLAVSPDGSRTCVTTDAGVMSTHRSDPEPQQRGVVSPMSRSLVTAIDDNGRVVVGEVTSGTAVTVSVAEPDGELTSRWSIEVEPSRFRHLEPS